MDVEAKRILELCKGTEGFAKNKGLKYYENVLSNKNNLKNMFLSFFESYSKYLLNNDFSFLFDEKENIRIKHDKDAFVPISYVFQTLKSGEFTRRLDTLKQSLLLMISECIHYKLLTDKEEGVFTIENIEILKTKARLIEGKPDECINGVKDGLIDLVKTAKPGMNIKDFMNNALENEALMKDITGMSKNMVDDPSIIHKFTNQMLQLNPKNKK